jgi:hypothetical protein
MTMTINRVAEGCLYKVAITGADISAKSTVTDFNGDTVDCRKLTRLSFTAQWTADSGAARAGRFKLQTTDDPRALTDPANAAWVDRTYPTGSTDGDATVATKFATIGTAAGIEQFNFEIPPSFARLVWDNTTAGTDGTVTIWVHGDR